MEKSYYKLHQMILSAYHGKNKDTVYLMDNWHGLHYIGTPHAIIRWDWRVGPFNMSRMPFSVMNIPEDCYSDAKNDGISDGDWTGESKLIDGRKVLKFQFTDGRKVWFKKSDLDLLPYSLNDPLLVWKNSRGVLVVYEVEGSEHPLAVFAGYPEK